jgi:hypothetical protein
LENGIIKNLLMVAIHAPVRLVMGQQQSTTAMEVISLQQQHIDKIVAYRGSAKLDRYLPPM